MKTFSEFMLECSQLDESSLSRIKSKSDKGGMAILSGSRGDKSSKENKARAKQLDRDIKGKGLPGATKVTGRWTENPGTKDEKKVKERSHVVTSGKKSKRKFKKAIKALGRKYDQDAVLTQTKKTDTLTATRKCGLCKDSQGKEVKRAGVGKMRPGRSSPQGDTKIKGKTFTYEQKL